MNDGRACESLKVDDIEDAEQLAAKTGKTKRTRMPSSFSTEEIDGVVQALKRVSQLMPEVMRIPGVRSVQDKFVRMQEKLDR